MSHELQPSVKLEIIGDDLRNKVTYEIELPDDPRMDYSPEEKALLRPIAETLAMLDGNAFFGAALDELGQEWYEQYLPEAWQLWDSNGGLDGWTGGMGHVAEAKLRAENPMLRSLWEQYQMALKLTKGDAHATT